MPENYEVVGKLRSELEDAKYELGNKQRDYDRVRAALLPLFPGEPEKVRAGWLAELAAPEIGRLREYAETTRYHQQNHAEAVRENERLRGELRKAQATTAEVSKQNAQLQERLAGMDEILNGLP